MNSHSRRTLKTSNLTPQKSTDSIAQINLGELDLYQEEIVRANKQQNIPEETAYNAQDNKISDAKESALARSPEKNYAKLSLEKSQNFEINLDEYSPITVGYSSRVNNRNKESLNQEVQPSNDVTLSNTEAKNSVLKNAIYELTPNKVQDRKPSDFEDSRYLDSDRILQTEKAKDQNIELRDQNTSAPVEREPSETLLAKRIRLEHFGENNDNSIVETKRKNLTFKSDELKLGLGAQINKFDKMMNLSLQMDEQYKSDKEFMERLFTANEDRIKHSKKMKLHLQSSSAFQKMNSFALEQGGNTYLEDSGAHGHEMEQEERGWNSWLEDLNELKLHEKSLQNQIDFMMEYLVSRQKKVRKLVYERQEEMDQFNGMQAIKDARETTRLYHRMQKSTILQNQAFKDGETEDQVIKKIKRGDRNDSQLYKGLINQFGFDDASDNTIVTLKENQSLGEALKGKSFDSAIEII